MTDQPELLPCPFCDELPKWGFDADPEIRLHYVNCSNLDCPVGPDVCAENEANAIAAWNARPAPVAEVKPLAVDILEMKLSGGRLEHWVRIKCGNRTYDVRNYPGEYRNRALYERDGLRHVLLGEPKPDLMSDEYADHLAHSPQEPTVEQAAGWQPIETAPKGGLIDIWLSDGVRWCDCYHDRITDTWRTSRPSGRLLSIQSKFVTHWMHRPEPPAGGSDHENK
ncbi:Lar family restriction alleviation protein [Leisingera sp. ANG-M7]|uniref:Lar family restriction alleviation protein n=1 Tax=Leisingera sp. ANG-M7 TaxID=1577902 RepID=UPI00057DFD89|nr:Lar family restriction alleviation protein [Leisingera sp. ANG-M7]KIC39392.1 hypothetical protein RA26_01715 [Leisingera sp. ANG-M7]